MIGKFQSTTIIKKKKKQFFTMIHHTFKHLKAIFQTESSHNLLHDHGKQK